MVNGEKIVKKQLTVIGSKLEKQSFRIIFKFKNLMLYTVYII